MTAAESDQGLREYRSVVRDFVRTHIDSAALRSAVMTSDGYDRVVWRSMSSDLGLAGIGAPAEAGGAGMAGQTMVCEELGRALDPSPYLSSVVLTGNVLKASGGADEYLQSIMDGEKIGTVAMVGTTVATRESSEGPEQGQGTWGLTGSARLVTHLGSADFVVLRAATERGPTAFIVQLDSFGASWTDAGAVDTTRRLGHLYLQGAMGVPIGAIGDGDRVMIEASTRSKIALAAEQVGGAARCLDMATEYALTRTQFGRSIGSFQAIKHSLADVVLAVKGARSVVEDAARQCDASKDADVVLAASAAVCASEAFMLAAGVNIQVHGGIGFTWEHDAHLFFKRANTSQFLLGAPPTHLDHIAEHLLGPV